MFRAEKSNFNSATNDVKQAAKQAGEAAEGMMNSSVGLVQQSGGSWIMEEHSTSILMENNTRILEAALDKFGNNLEQAHSELESTLSSKRDAVMSAIESSTSNPDQVYYDNSSSVIAPLLSVKSALTDLQAKCSSARAALSGLEDSGNIDAALLGLENEIRLQEQVMTELDTAFTNFQSAVENFESQYSALLGPSQFVTDDIVKIAQKGMQASYANSAIGKLDGVLDSIKDLTNFDLGSEYFEIKDAFELIGKPLAELSEFSEFISFSGLAGFKGDWVTKLTEWARPSSWRSAFRSMRSTDGLDPALMKNINRTGLFSRLDPDKAVKWGTRAKGVGKAIGLIGDAVSVYDIGSNAYEAYMTEPGDFYDKAAAAVVTGGGKAIKFATGKAIGAAVGTVVGGPVGALVGVGVGMFADWALDKVGDWLTNDDNGPSVADKIKGGISSGLRAIGDFFTGGNKEQENFAPTN